MGYYRLAEERRAVFWLEGWIRRNIREVHLAALARCAGSMPRIAALGRARVDAALCADAPCGWFVAARAMMHTALSNRTLRRYGFVMPSDLAASG